MKILMITPYLPYPLYSGGQVRSYHLIKNLARKHEIYLVALVKNSKEEQFVPELEKICAKVWVFPRPASPWSLKNIFKTGFSLKPFLVVRNFSIQAAVAIRRILNEYKFDLIHAETFYVMPHLPPVTMPVLLVEQTIECEVYSHFVKFLPWYLFFLKPLLWLDVTKLRWWEKFYWRKADLVAAVSEDDRVKIRQLVPDLVVKVVSNGVDCAHFEQKVARRSSQPTVLFVGNFKWLQNKEAARILLDEIWPRVIRKYPQAKLLVIGRHSREFVGEKTGVEMGEIADIREAYQRAHVFIAPFRSGGGSRLKIFEAMASGLPVVSTAKGVEGVGVLAGVHYLQGETSSRLASLVLKLLKNKAEAARLGRAAKAYIAQHYDWQIPARQLVEVYETLKKN